MNRWCTWHSCKHHCPADLTSLSPTDPSVLILLPQMLKDPLTSERVADVHDMLNLSAQLLPFTAPAAALGVGG